MSSKFVRVRRNRDQRRGVESNKVTATQYDQRHEVLRQAGLLKYSRNKGMRLLYGTAALRFAEVVSRLLEWMSIHVRMA